MSCSNCTSAPLNSFAVSYFLNNQPSNCADADCGSNSLNSKCIYYAGPNLSCSAIVTGDSLELSLQKIDTKLCAVLGNYSTYTINCLPGPITTEAAFVSAITSYACTLNTTLSTFTTSTFPTYQGVVGSRFSTLEQPSITNASSQVLSSDSIWQVLGKFGGKFTALDSALSLSGINWSEAYSVPTPPSTLAGGFQTLLDQLTQLKTSGTAASLPVFNNLGTCLVSPGATDSLVDTVGKIKTRLCQTPLFDINALSWTCVTKPSTTTTDLQNAFQALMNKVNSLSQSMPSFSADFAVTATSGSDSCAGKTVALASAASINRLVAANNADTAPSTLINKLAAGTGISIDDTTTPGKVTIIASGTADDKKVKAHGDDPSPDFLVQKIAGVVGDAGLLINSGYSTATHQLLLTPTIDLGAFITALASYLADHSEALAAFCTLVNSCPSPCAPVTNAQAVPISSTTTTTTTV